MKKIITLAISLLLFFPLVGCTANEEDTNTPNNQTEDGEVPNGTEGDVEKQIEDSSDGQNNSENNEKTD